MEGQNPRQADCSGPLIGGLVLAIVTEFSQLAIPGRSFNPVDMACNFAGILAGVAAVYALSWKVTVRVNVTVTAVNSEL